MSIIMSIIISMRATNTKWKAACDDDDDDSDIYLSIYLSMMHALTHPSWMYVGLRRDDLDIRYEV